MQNRRAIKIFEAYDQSLSKVAISPPLPLSSPASAHRRIHAVYFCCHRDFTMLRMSLVSLLAHGGGKISRIYVYEDESDPLTGDEKRDLLSLTPLSIVSGPRYTGWGAEALVRGLNFYRRMLADVPAGASAWLLKIDADLLFLNSHVFQQIADCREDMFGQPYTHPRGLTYSQGGCYAITTEFLHRLLATPVSEVMHTLSAKIGMPISHLPEDACVFSLAARNGPRVKFSDFYLPAERIPTFVPSATEPASAIHFETGGGKNLRLHMPRIANCAASPSESRRAA
ncbi:MAG TPA: hypothetical protein VHD36_20355 [Pirellulales bacterium]|nr:hypothetical protein [Pirellulales bacterium]